MLRDRRELVDPARTSRSCCAVATGPIVTSSFDGSPTLTRASRSSSAVDHGRDAIFRDVDAADRGALLSGFLRHVAHDVADEEVERVATTRRRRGRARRRSSCRLRRSRGRCARRRDLPPRSIAPVVLEPVNASTSCPSSNSSRSPVDASDERERALGKNFSLRRGSRRCDARPARSSSRVC